MRIFATSLIAAAATAAGITPVHVNPATRFIEDSYGRTVIFHGVNAIYKMPPYIPITDSFDPQESLNDKDIADLVKWGQNFVRLGVMWEAVEREPGVYDDDYLNKIEDLINEMGEAGIYTLVDAHQDVFARTMCGEGIPDFYAKEVIGSSPSCVSPTIDALLKPLYDFMGICLDLNDFGYRIDENGDPLIEDCLTVPGGFGTFYDTKQGVNGFGALFENQNGLRDKFVNFWDHTSARFAKNPYVVGYDPLNEPYPGNDVKHPEYRIPGRLDATLLQDTYTEVYERYKKNDEGNAIMWFEPVTQRDINGWFRGGTIFPAGFTNPPGAEIGSDKHVFNDHTYCCQLAGDICATGEPDQSKLDECLVWHNKRIGTRDSDAKRLGVPFMLSEFGACLNEESCTNEIKQVTDVCDNYLIGWAYW
jgi:endoglycosylceramidase